MTVEMFNEEVRRAARTKSSSVSCVNTSHDISMAVLNGTRRSCGSDELLIWHFDSESSSHLTNSRSGILNFRIRFASEQIMPCEGVGDLKVLFVFDREDLVTLHSVPYVPIVTHNLFSLRAMVEESHKFVGGDEHISLFAGQFKFPIRAKLY